MAPAEEEEFGVGRESDTGELGKGRELIDFPLISSVASPTTATTTAQDQNQHQHDKPGVSSSQEEIAPLISTGEEEKSVVVSIFSVVSRRPNPRRRTTTTGESTLEEPSTEFILPNRFALWAWSGSTYSGFICMALGSIFYSIMEVVTKTFSEKTLPLFENVSIRSTIVLVLSYAWLRRSGQSILGPLVRSRGFLSLRALIGCISVVCFIYSVKNLPVSDAILLNFMTPAMACFTARLINKEKLTFTDIGGMVCSFLGLLFLYRPMFVGEGLVSETREMETSDKAGGILYTLVGTLSALTGGISFCLVKSGARATEQPILTVFAFGMLASPLSAICVFSFEKFILPADICTIFLTVALGVLAFLAEVFIARGLQLEKISKVTNILYLKVFLTQVCDMALDRDVQPSIGRLFGCMLILASTISTLYIGPYKEAEYVLGT